MLPCIHEDPPASLRRSAPLARVFAFHEHGYAILEDVLSAEEVTMLRAEVSRLSGLSGDRGGVRNVLEPSALVCGFAVRSAPAELARSLLGPTARPVKGTLFDKTGTANWKVPWHQDLTIAVRTRREVPGFGPWSLKDGVPHVQPPAEILAGMVAVRVHLDHTSAENGALRVVPGSHRLGRLTPEQIAALTQACETMTCPVGSGGLMVMRPLLLHASSASAAPEHRRVLHLEYACYGLPGGLEWP